MDEVNTEGATAPRRVQSRKAIGFAEIESGGLPADFGRSAAPILANGRREIMELLATAAPRSPTAGSMGQHPLARMLRKLGRLAHLELEDQKAVLALPHVVQQLAPNNFIIREGDASSHATALVAGFAFQHKVVGNGGRQVIAFNLPGDLVDLQTSLLGTADHNVQALTRAEIAIIPREAVAEIALSRPAVGMAMWYGTLLEASIQREWTVNVGRRDARTRTAHLLCELGERLRAEGLSDRRAYELPMTQDQLADALSLTSVHVNRMLQTLDREGLTKRKRRSLVIRDWARLAAVGDFDPRYLHLQPRAAGAGAPTIRTGVTT